MAKRDDIMWQYKDDSPILKNIFENPQHFWNESALIDSTVPPFMKYFDKNKGGQILEYAKGPKIFSASPNILKKIKAGTKHRGGSWFD